VATAAVHGSWPSSAGALCSTAATFSWTSTTTVMGDVTAGSKPSEDISIAENISSVSNSIASHLPQSAQISVTTCALDKEPQAASELSTTEAGNSMEETGPVVPDVSSDIKHDDSDMSGNKSDDKVMETVVSANDNHVAIESVQATTDRSGQDIASENVRDKVSENVAKSSKSVDTASESKACDTNDNGTAVERVQATTIHSVHDKVDGNVSNQGVEDVDSESLDAVHDKAVDDDVGSSDKDVDREKSPSDSIAASSARQVVTLPIDILSHFQVKSLPIHLSLKHSCNPLSVTVPTSSIYPSASGLRLLLPTDTLPAEYLSGKQLVCSVQHSSSRAPPRHISINVTLH